MIQSIENGRKEDGNRSIADKIIKRLHDLDKTVENNQGRWAWELLQNAKDSIAEHEGRTVSIKIVLDQDTVEFSHNGMHFTEQDIRGLINQISSKEIEEGVQTKKTGRFGTGFLTTHLLSKVIQVKGVVETESEGLYSFEFPLDRRGINTPQLMPKIEEAWSQFQHSTKHLSIYDEHNFNTSFCYHLETVEQKKIAKIGVEEFLKLIPFVLAFNPKIYSVEIIDNTSILSNTLVFVNKQELLKELILPITRIENEVETTLYILLAKNERVAIATEIIKTTEGYSFANIKDIPKLFCDFPLIGTENFHFPVIINSFYFNPQTERDGIWLKGKKDGEDKEVDENQELLANAVNLFSGLISNTSKGDFFDFYNIAETRMPSTNDKYFDDLWYKEQIQQPLRDIILNAKIVDLEYETTEKKSIKNVFFPSKIYSKEIRTKLWKYYYDLYPAIVCKQSHLHYWCDKSWEDWNKLDYSELIGDVSKEQSIEKLSLKLNIDEIKAFDWLNSVCKFILEDEINLALFEKSNLIPNKYGVFKRRSELYIDKIKDDGLIEILELLGDDWRNILLHDNVSFGKYQVKERKSVAESITDKLKSTISKHEDTKTAISLLSEWFEYNQEEGRELFAELYRKRAELFMNTITDKDSLYKVMRSKTGLDQLSKVAQAMDENPQLLQNMKEVEELNNLLREFEVSNVSELKSRLANSVNLPKLEITQEILASLGVTTIEEMEEALKDKNIATQYFHTSTPNLDAFLHAQTLISRAKRNILNHLKSLTVYDCSELEELATTVIGGIKKEGLLIPIVIRPSDYGYVIVHYSSEKDTLDFVNGELWIDNGVDVPRHLTLGKILKNTGINKIPV